MSSSLTQELVFRYFRGRTDSVGRMGVSGPLSVKVHPGEFDRTIEEHITGQCRIGVYNLLPNDEVMFAILDFDSHGEVDTQRINASRFFSSLLQRVLSEHGIPSYREVSKSGPGNYHLWIFWENPISSSRVRKSLDLLLQVVRTESGFDFACEVFPKQDHSHGGPGNFVWLPLFPPDVEMGRTIFVDPSDNPITPEFMFTTADSLEILYRKCIGEVERGRRQDDDQQIGEFRPQSSPLAALLGDTTVRTGNRHNTLTRIIGHLKSRRIPADAVQHIVSAWNGALVEPLSENEVMSTVTSLFRDARHVVNQVLTVHSALDLVSANMVPPPDLIAGIVRAQSLTFLAGESGAGKSLMAMNLAVSVAIGSREYLGYQLVRSGRVIFLNNEIHHVDFALRLKAMTRHIVNQEALANLLVPEPVPIVSECAEDLRSLCETHTPVLLVLDCLYFAHDRDENDSSEMRKLMQFLLELRDRYGMAILVVHHLRKVGKDKSLGAELMRGSGVFSAAADNIFLLRTQRTDAEKRVLKPVKLRHAGDRHKLERNLELEGATLCFRVSAVEPGMSAEPPLMEPKPEVDWPKIFHPQTLLSFGQIMARLPSLNVKTVQRAIVKGMKRGIIRRPSYGKYELVETLGARGLELGEDGQIDTVVAPIRGRPVSKCPTVTSNLLNGS